MKQVCLNNLFFRVKGAFLLFVLIFCNGLVISQTVPKFDLTKDGVKPVVISFDTSYHASLIYNRVKEWISINNKNPQSIIRIDNKNSLVKFSCYKEKGWKIRNNGADIWNELKYTLKVDIKEAKCRITFETEDLRYKVWYNKDGTLIKKFKESESGFEATINETLTSLCNHIKSTGKKLADDW